MRVNFAVIVLLLAQMSFAVAKPTQPNCGITSALALAEMRGVTVPAKTVEELLNTYPQAVVSLSDVKKMATSLGMETVAVKATLNDLLKKQRPAIVHLTNPDHFVLLIDGSHEQLRLLENPRSTLSIIPRILLERRFDGYALITPEVSGSVAPRIQFEEADFQFGIAGVGQKIQHDYKFTNIGKQILVVTITGSSCGCTAAIFKQSHTSLDGNADKMALKLGQSSYIRVSYEVSKVGTVQQSVALTTNDPLHPVIYLTVRGTVPQNLKVTPSSLLMNSEKGQPLVRDVKVTGPLPMNIVSVKSSSHLLNITTELISTDDTKKSWLIHVTQAEDTPVGESQATLTIKTTHPERPLITIPVSIEVRGDLQATPGSAFFGFVKQGDSRRLDFVIASRTGTSFKITSAEFVPADMEALSIKSIDNQNVPQHKFSLHLNADKPQFIKSQLKIETSNVGETLLIPVTAMIESGDDNQQAFFPGQQEAAQLPRAEDDPQNKIATAQATVKVGQPAPDFDVKDADGKSWKLSTLKGKKAIVLTFFPKCFTGGCANHLSSLRDHQAEFDKNDVQVLAVSVDPAEGEKGQKAFAQQWKLLFPLIPDTQRVLSKLYGAVQQNDERAARMTFLIDKAGIVRFVDTDVHVQTHGADVLAKLRELGIIQKPAQ